MHSASFTLTAGDGTRLFVQCWLPETIPKAVVQIAHGLAEHAGRYARLAEALTGAGYGVYANDHRGHGHTARRAEDLGYFADEGGWRKCVADMRDLNRRIAADHDGVPIILLGHSMGSFLCQDFIIEHGGALSGCVLSATNGKPPPTAWIGRLIGFLEQVRLGRRGRSTLLHALALGAMNRPFKPARTPFDWLSRDAAEVDKYIADPLCGFIPTVQLYLDLIGGLVEIARPSRQARIPRSLPIYVICGDRDPAGRNVEQLLRAYRRAGLARVSHRFYAAGRHEILNELNRDEVTRNLIAWLDETVEGPR